MIYRGPWGFRARCRVPVGRRDDSFRQRTVSCHHTARRPRPLLRRLPQRQVKTGGLRARHRDRRQRRASIRKIGRRSSASCARATCRPPDCRGPTSAPTDALVSSLETSLDRAAAAHPNPGRTDTFRRLNRTEYQNAIRDLLALDVDVSVAAAQRRVEPRLRQRDGRRSLADAAGALPHGRAEDQPAGHRQPRPLSRRRHRHASARPHPGSSTSTSFRSARAAALVVHYTFPLDAEYEIQRAPARATATSTSKGLTGTHEVELMLDGERVRLFTVKPPAGRQRSSRWSTRT